jgi:hypothetical protein
VFIYRYIYIYIYIYVCIFMCIVYAYEYTYIIKTKYLNKVRKYVQIGSLNVRIKVYVFSTWRNLFLITLVMITTAVTMMKRWGLVYICVCICMCVYIYVCIDIIYIHVYIYMYIYINDNLWSLWLWSLWVVSLWLPLHAPLLWSCALWLLAPLWLKDSF